MQPDNLLIVDDESLIRMNLRIYFEGKGYHVEEAETGEAGLSLLEKNTFSLCILDDGLPDTTAQQFIIQAYKVLPILKYVIYTGTVNYELPPALKDYGLTQSCVLYKAKDGLSDIADRVAAIVMSE